MSTEPIDIRNNEAESRFEYDGDGGLAVAEYRREGDRITFTHTEVPDSMAGGGVGGQLARTALEFARSENLCVIPHCSFIASYIRRHPEYGDLVARDE